MYKAGFLASSFDSWRAGWAAGSIPVREPIVPGLEFYRGNQGWKKYRTTGPLVPENVLSSQKIFPQERKKKNCKTKTLTNRKDITCTCRYALGNAIISAFIL